MLNENIKAIRKAKGLSQQELAVKLNIVRQTVSKWEQGLSVPDADLLIALSQALETPVSTLLGETCAMILVMFAALIIVNSPYLGWDYSDPETAVLGVAFHAFEWLFVRVAPVILIAALIGIFFTRKKD